MSDSTIDNKKTVSEDEILTHAFLTIEEVSILLRVSTRSVYNLIYSGALKATKVSYHVTVITKEDFMLMIKENTYSKKKQSIFSKKKTKRTEIEAPETAASPVKETEEISLQRKGNKDDNEAVAVVEKPKKSTTKPKAKYSNKTLIPSSAYNQSVRDTFIDKYDGELYTMADVCRIYGYSYGKFYNLRMRYEIPCVKADATKCFPKNAVDKAMEAEKQRLGRDLTEHWYSCFDIMRIYGLGKTQVRRFAQTHNVRIKQINGNRNYYLKADWDAARKEAEAKSTSTKSKRETN